MDDSGIYEDPGTAGATPTTEASRPEGGGVHSGTADGANKADPVSAGPNVGNTIAGRTAETGTIGGPGSISAGRSDAEEDWDSPSPAGSQTGGADTGGRGVTGTTGREPAEGHEPSKGAATEQINPGDAETGTADAP